MTKGPKGPFVIESQNDLAVERGLIALATHDAQQSQQALEHIHDVHVQGQGGTDVVGLAAVDVDLQAHLQRRQMCGPLLAQPLGGAARAAARLLEGGGGDRGQERAHVLGGAATWRGVQDARLTIPAIQLSTA